MRDLRLAFQLEKEMESRVGRSPILLRALPSESAAAFQHENKRCTSVTSR